VTVRVENLDIAGPAGRLEGLLNVGEGEVRRIALVCHPHPLYGGTMHNNVVYHTARALRERGLAVLRFNFRGVGRSEGAYDEGRGEADDVRAALAEMEGRFPGLPCWLAGFSFGAWVGLRAGMSAPRVDGLLAVGLPVANHDVSWLDRCRVAVAVIAGGGDEFAPEDALRRLLDSLSCPTRLEIVADAGHFFPGRFEELRSALGRAADFLEDVPENREAE
jgi:alpha/beta superfamily hydrolase